MTRIAVLGDCLLDVSVAPRAVVSHGGDVPASISLGPGGQAANIAVRLARRGVPARLVAPIGHDPIADLLRARMAAEGVELIAIPAARSVAVVVLRTSDGERTMLSDREPLPPGWQAALTEAAVGAGWLVCSGYALLDPVGAQVAEALGSRPQEVRLAVAGAAVPPAGAEPLRRAVGASRPDLVVLSRGEADALGPGLPGLVVVTDPTGAEAVGPDATRVEARAEGTPTDTTGAGDAFLAALLAAVADGPWPPSVPALRSALRTALDAGSSTTAVTGAQGRIGGERLPLDAMG